MKPTIVIGIIVPLMLALAGCNSAGPNLIVTKAVVNVPPAALLRCGVTELPDSFASNKDVATFMIRDRVALLKCYHNMQAVKSYLAQEKAIVEGSKK